ncbi:MAG: CHAT domain-containing tetratricopeptide repeat protein [Bacteroidia bacterium]
MRLYCFLLQVGLFTILSLSCTDKKEVETNYHEGGITTDTVKSNLDFDESTFLNHIKKDTIAYQKLNEGLELSSKGQIEQAISEIDSSLYLYQDQGNYHGIVKAEFEVGRILYNQEEYPSAKVRFQAVIDTLKKQIGINNYLVPEAYYYLARCHFDSEVFDSAEFYLVRSIDYYENQILDSLQLANCFLLFGEIHKSFTGDYEKAESLFIDARDIFKLKKEDLEDLSYTRAEFALADLYRIQGEYPKSIIILESILSIRQKILGSEHTWVVNTLINTGNTYFEMGELDQAKLYYQNALEKVIKEPGRLTLKATLYHGLGLVNDELKNYENASDFYIKALTLWQRVIGENNTTVANTLMNLGLVNLHQGKYDNTQKFYKKALDIHKVLYPPSHPEIAWSLIEVGYLYEIQGNTEKALDFYNQAANLIYPDSLFYSLDFPYEHKISDPHIFLKALNGKADMLYQLGKNNTQPDDYLTEAYGIFQQADKLIDFLRKEYKDEDVRFFLGDRTSEIYEKAIRTCFELIKVQPEQADDYLNAALFFMEKSKAKVMMEALMETNAKSRAQVSSATIEEEKLILDSLNWARQEQMKEKIISYDQDSVTSVSKQVSYENKLATIIYRLKEKHEALIKKLESQNPQYYQLKYNFTPPSLEQIQTEILDSTAAICEYFWGENELFSIVIIEDEVREFRYRLTNQDNKIIAKIRDAMSQDDIYSNWKANNDSLNHYTSVLYNKILKDQVDFIEKNRNIKRLKIIPDGYLSLVPFEILIRNRDHETPHYLLQDYHISYAFSTARLFQSKRPAQKSSANQILGLAFSEEEFTDKGNNHTRFQPLYGAARELKQLSKSFRGKYLWGKEANKQSFLDNCEDYAILHLAVHGVESSKETGLPTLYFPNVDSPYVDALTVTDIMNLNIPAELITLGACETGLGEEYAGEGIISLAYGFGYAGAQSIITTLWPVSDHSSSTLMVLFYENLSNGLAKDVALHKAKMDFLDQADQLQKHPAFWASYIAYGDMDPLKPEKKASLIFRSFLLIISILTFLCIFILYSGKYKIYLNGRFTHRD